MRLLVLIYYWIRLVNSIFQYTGLTRYVRTDTCISWELNKFKLRHFDQGLLYSSFNHFVFDPSPDSQMTCLTRVMLNNLWCHAHFKFSARLLNPSCSYKFKYLMTNSADPDQLRSQLSKSPVCKGRVYPDSAGQGLKRIGMIHWCNV